MPRRPSRTPVLALLLLLGCIGADDTVAEWSVDTLEGGVVVARNSAGHAGALRTIALEEVVRIGAADEGAAAFGRVSDVALGPDDRIYVLDGIAQEVRVFALDGAHVRTFGGAGGGPGELGGAYALAFDPRGTLWIAEEGERRYSLYDTAGTFVGARARPIRWPVHPGALGFAADGSLHEHGWWGRAGGVVRMTVGDPVVVRDTVPLPPYAVPVHRRAPEPGRESLGMRVAFAAAPTVAVGADGAVWVGAGGGDAYRIARLGARGDTSRLVALEVVPTPFSDAERAMAADTARVARERGFVETEGAAPTAHPYFTDVAVSDLGELWVRRASSLAAARPDGRRGAVYDVFGRDGRLLGSTNVALDGEPAPQIARGMIVGVARDSLDVPSVVVYRRAVSAP